MVAKHKACIVIRVYNRIADLEDCLDIISKTWRVNEYFIIVVFNGKSHGYSLPQNIDTIVDRCIILDDNLGHMIGSSQLLIEATKYITSEYEYTVILEADTWIYGDNLITKYIDLLIVSGAVWASAQWYDRFYSLATDFAIIDTKFLIENSKIFYFTNYAECSVVNYLKDRNLKYLLITENMPTMFPSYISSFWHAPKNRINVFLKSKMITYHIEDLKGGMAEKRCYFNIVSGMKYFNTPEFRNPVFFKLSVFFTYFFNFILPKRSWICKRIYFMQDQIYK